MRYDPFAELDALQKQFFGSDTFTPVRGLSLPTTDVYTNNDKELIVEAHLPHFEEKDVHVEVEKNVLVVRAERHEKQEDKDKKYVVRESSSSFYRRIHLPDRANTDNIKANLEDGVLKVTVPFKELPQPKKIAIASKSKK
jgi:HSP20 family protein